MSVSRAQQKATNKWIAKAYDRINLTVPKGKKEIIQSHAAARGESVNGFINAAIDEKMERDGLEGRTEPAEAGDSTPYTLTTKTRPEGPRGPLERR